MATAKQIAARKLFAKRAKAGEFKRGAKRKRNPGGPPKGSKPRPDRPWGAGAAPGRQYDPADDYEAVAEGFALMYGPVTAIRALPGMVRGLIRAPEHVYESIEADPQDFARRVSEYARALGKNPRGRSAKGVKRASQATGKAPSARLVKRRKATKRAPAGFYANPSPTRAPGAFEVWTVKHGVRDRYVATFIKKAEAVAYARAYADAHSVAVGIRGAK